MSDLFPETVETDRLHLERLHRENVDALTYYEHCSRRNPHIEEITEHLTWDPHETPKETAEFIEAMEAAWDAGEDATYVVRVGPGGRRTGGGETADPRADGEPGAGVIAGATGLHVDWPRRTAKLGTWLRKPFWGRGYSGERAAALMDVAFDRLDLDVVAVTHRVGNEKSRRAIEKYVERAGGRCEGRFRNFDAHPDGPVDVRRYTVAREEWERNR